MSTILVKGERVIYGVLEEKNFYISLMYLIENSLKSWLIWDKVFKLVR